eukprot:6997785-Prymnesium_polylepis.1
MSLTRPLGARKAAHPRACPPARQRRCLPAVRRCAASVAPIIAAAGSAASAWSAPREARPPARTRGGAGWPGPPARRHVHTVGTAHRGAADAHRVAPACPDPPAAARPCAHAPLLHPARELWFRLARHAGAPAADAPCCPR